MFFRWGFHRRAGSLCCCYIAPSYWLEVASPSPSVPFFLRDNSHEDLPEPCWVTKHFWNLLVFSLVPTTAPASQTPYPTLKWMGQGQCAIVRCHSRRGGRAMQQPEHLLPAHCSKASSLKRINSPYPRTVHIWVVEVPLRHPVCPNTWGLLQRQGRHGRSLVEAQEPLCHS